jgi:hypothetical protein
MNAMTDIVLLDPSLLSPIELPGFLTVPGTVAEAASEPARAICRWSVDPATGRPVQVWSLAQAAARRRLTD